MASASSSSGSGPNAPRKYDVFISFRGEDTRYNFTSHLHAALKRAFLEVFLDDKKLEKGYEIRPSLIQAIKDSSVSVIVISYDYASSKWCLDELAEIMECRKNEGQFVIPIFYKVEPSDVRNQTGDYGKAFEQHGKDYPDRVSRWRAALSEAGNLSGTHCQASTDETKLIKDIVSVVSTKLELIPNWRVTLKDVIGRDRMIEPIKELLEKYHKVGIWGMGGVGKTTMAKVVFAILSSQYDSRCFLENVREETERKGLKHVRDSLVSKLQGKDMQLDSSNKEFVARRLGMTKAFVVLDDVDTIEQLKDLHDNICNFLGEGSKVIVTTRDQKLLRRESYEIHEVKGLSYENSRQLFTCEAFGSNNLEAGYEELITAFVDYTQHNALALKVLGSYVHSEDKKYWNGLLRKLRAGNPNCGIQNVLRLSYDRLDHKEKQIFLEIACFLKGEREGFVEELLESYGLFPTVGMSTLIDRALIVKTNGKVEMHDLLQEMGHQIVREENINEPGKRSRLWDSREILEVLTNFEGENEVKGISLFKGLFEMTGPLILTAKTFTKMTKLRFLKIFDPKSDISTPTGLDSISTEIRYFHWKGYPMMSLPSDFCAKHLIELNLERSLIETLWEGVQDLVNLRRLNLRRCHKLRELPDFSKAWRLESVNLRFCSRLCYVHASLLSLHSLISLDASNCNSLESLQSRIHLKSLEKIDLHMCENLKKFSMSSKELTSLYLNKTKIEELSPSIWCCTKLRVLNLHKTRLKNLPDNITQPSSLEELNLSDCPNLTKLPDNMSILSQLQYLSVGDCTKLRSLPEPSPSLRQLIATGCKSLETVSFTTISSLEWVQLENCPNLTKLPNNMRHLSKLQYLSVRGCSGLRSLPEPPPSLRELIATCCKSLETVSFTTISSLEWVQLDNCPNLTKLPDNMSHLSKLQYLSVRGCSGLRSLPEPPPSLRELIATGCKSLETVSFTTISSLERVQLENCPNLTKLPDNMRHLSKLQYLSVRGCSGLRSLPEPPPSLRELIATGCKSLETVSFTTISSLERVQLQNCPNLTKLPHNMSHLSKLQYLSVKGCTELRNLPEPPTFLRELIATCCKSLETVSFKTISRLERVQLENCPNLTKLPDNMRHLSKLQYLSVKGCSGLRSLPEPPPSLSKFIATGCKSLETVSFTTISSLEMVQLKNCPNLTKLPDNMSHLSKLQYLSVGDCTELRSLPEPSPSLRQLIVTGCKSLETVSFTTISSLEWVQLENCPNLTKLPDNMSHLSKLQFLSVQGCTKLRSLPEPPPSLKQLIFTRCKYLETVSFTTISSLEWVQLENCPNLTKLPDKLGHLSKLQYLSVKGCIRLRSLPDPPPSLKELIATGCKSLETVSFTSISSLERVQLENCSNLTKLPDNTRHLSKLQFLSVEGCIELRSLPDPPPSLRELIASGCKSLETVSLPPISNIRENYGEKIFSFIKCDKLDLGAIEEQAKMLFENAVHEEEDVYGDVIVYYPGGKVPDWFGNNRTQKDLNTLKLSLSSHTLVGFVFCVVCPPDFAQENNWRLEISFSIEEDKMTDNVRSEVLDCLEFCPGNVLLFSLPDVPGLILEEIEGHRGNHTATTYNPNLFFTFGFRNWDDDYYPSQECGVYPVYASGDSELNSNSRKRKAIDNNFN